jgi:hypothetical protein
VYVVPVPCIRYQPGTYIPGSTVQYCTVHTVDNGSKRRVSHRQSICPAFVWPFSELENAKIRLIVVVISAWIMAMMPMAVETLIEQSTSLSL